MIVGSVGFLKNFFEEKIKVSKIIIGYRCIYKKELIEIAKKLKVPYTIMKPSYADENYHLIEVNN